MKKLFKKAKKVSLLALGLVVLVSNTINVQASMNLEEIWTQFRGNVELAGITDSKLPTNSSEVTERWAKKYSSGSWIKAGMPIVVGDYIYYPSGSNINRIDKETGEVIAKGDLAQGLGFFSRMAYGDGKVFVPIGAGQIQAFDAVTLESLWITAPIQYMTSSGAGPYNTQPLCPITYYDGQVYMGVSDGSGSYGEYFSVTTVDENPNETLEIKDFKWEYKPSTDKKGYYWSGSTIVNNKVIFAGENGQIVSLDAKTGEFIDMIQGDGSVRSSVHFNKENNKIYATTKNGYIQSVKVNVNGTFDHSTFFKNKIGTDITSSPVTYNGRLYVGGGGISSNAGFYVLDADTLETIYTLNLKTQSSPILTTAYASEENNNQVYLYVMNYSNPDHVYVIEDNEGKTAGSYEQLITPSQPQYNTSSATIDEDGTIYFRNDSGYLFSFESENGKYTSEDVVRAIGRIAAKSSLSENDMADINRIYARFDSLSVEEQGKVTNIAELESAKAKVEELIANKDEVLDLINAINLLPNPITITDRALVNDLISKYSVLSEDNKDKVINIQALLDAKNIIDILVIEEDSKAAIEKINSLPSEDEVSLENELAINEVYDFYANISDDAKDKVTNKEKLISLKNKVDKIRADVDSINDDIWNKINPMNISINDKENVMDLMNRYEALNDKDKKYVTYYQDVLDAYNKIIELEKHEDNSLSNSDTADKNTTDKNSKLPQTGEFPYYAVIAILFIILGSSVVIKNRKRA